MKRERDVFGRFIPMLTVAEVVRRRSAYARKWAAEHRKKKREYDKQYRAANREKRRAYARWYYQTFTRPATVSSSTECAGVLADCIPPAVAGALAHSVEESP